jgi:hypothetical protein
MKRCPICEKTFDDNLRFCQADGTPLVDDVEEVDPFKTMVARPGEFAAAVPPAKPDKPAEEEPVLDIPDEVDSNKTQVVSEAELRAEMAKIDDPGEQVVEIPPVAEPLPPEPPKFHEPSPTPPSFAETPPPSPFAEAGKPEPSEPSFSQTSAPIPSPFGDPKPPVREAVAAEAEVLAPEPIAEPVPPAAEPEPAFNPFSQPFEQSGHPTGQADLATPKGQDFNMQTPQEMSPSLAPTAAGGKSSMLAIVSLIVGILSICCGYLFVPGLIAIVLGFMARGKAKNDPENYGGGGLALVGILAGILSLLVGAALIALWFLGLVTTEVFDQLR